MSSLDSVSTGNSNTGILKPSRVYNKDIIERQRQCDREENLRKIEEANRKLKTKDNKQEKEHKGMFGFSSLEKLRTSFRGSSKSDAIREWEQRQANKRNEKGLFATMDTKGYGNNCGNFEGWSKNKPKEVIRTVYVPVRVNSSPPTVSRSASRASTDLPPYREGQEQLDQVFGEGYTGNKKVGIYPKCPSPDTEEIEEAKLKSWIEYTENQEMSVDKLSFLQRKRSSTIASSLAMGTLFEGYDEEDSYVESDEINIIPSCTEYDGDWDSLEEQENMDSDLEEADKAMRLTRPYNIGTPIGRRCPKSSSATRQDPGTTIGQYGVLESKSVLRLRGGAKSTSGDSENNQMETDFQIVTNKRNLVTSPDDSTPMNPTKLRKEQSPGTPKEEMEKACFYQRKAREMTMYFEKFKNSTKKKLNASNNSELDKGVELMNDLVTELCLENIHYIRRYTELKRMYDELEDSRKKVGFVSPLPPSTARRNLAEENLTTDTETETTKKKRKSRKKKKKNTAATDKEVSTSVARPQAHNTDTDAPNLGTEASRPMARTSSSRNKKEKEKEVLDKCRAQVAPIKFVVSTGDKTVEDTKKLLWTQVVSKNKAPKIKELVTLKGGDLLIIPADDKTKEAIKSLAVEGFGITQTGSFLPKVIIYDVDREIKPDELSARIAQQNPEMELTDEDIKRIVPRFKTGPRDQPYVHWVCEVHQTTFRKINDKRVYISYSLCRITEYLQVTKCNKCQKFGHIAAKCRSKVDICAFCAIEGHRKETCPNKDKPAKCANCGGPFTAGHAGCTYKVTRIRAQVRNTNYGSP